MELVKSLGHISFGPVGLIHAHKVRIECAINAIGIQPSSASERGDLGLSKADVRKPRVHVGW